MPTAYTFILASQSPRRQRMLQWLGIPFTTLDVDLDETPLLGEAPADLAARLAYEKGAAAVPLTAEPAYILTADTVVDLDGQTLGKPADAAEARTMLEALRGRRHQVHTAVALADPFGAIEVRRVTTDVRMRDYTDAEVAAYIATGDPMDKAGAYAIQHRGFHPVARVEICYANVVGLPLGAVVQLIGTAEERLSPQQSIGEGRGRWTMDVRTICAREFGYRECVGDEGTEV